MKRKRNTTRDTPWGRILGLMTAVVVTLLCIARGVEPVVIVQRSLFAFVTVAWITASVIFVLQRLNERSEMTR